MTAARPVTPWTRDLPRLPEPPAGRCILSLDSMTDMRKAKEILGDHLCIMGDVPPALLSSGTPEQVFGHCTRLVRDIGPTGYLMQSGCDIPVDAPLANVKAMADAAEAAAGWTGAVGTRAAGRALTHRPPGRPRALVPCIRPTVTARDE